MSAFGKYWRLQHEFAAIVRHGREKFREHFVGGNKGRIAQPGLRSQCRLMPLVSPQKGCR